MTCCVCWWGLIFCLGGWAVFNVGVFQVVMYMYRYVVLIFCVRVRGVLVIVGGGWK